MSQSMDEREHGEGHHPALAHQFDSLAQQRGAVTFGMWLFLVNEVMFFGGLFMAYVLYRIKYTAAFIAASHHLDVTLGTINTVVLISSSFTVVLAVHAAEQGKKRATSIYLVLTLLLGFVFLGIKAHEYHHKYVEHLIPGPSFHLEGAAQHAAKGGQIFFILYFAMTGMHALHMIIGAGIFGWLLYVNEKGKIDKAYNAPVEVCGLYWHFVDIVWIFLFPLLYLISRH